MINLKFARQCGKTRLKAYYIKNFIECYGEKLDTSPIDKLFTSHTYHPNGMSDIYYKCICDNVWLYFITDDSYVTKFALGDIKIYDLLKIVPDVYILESEADGSVNTAYIIKDYNLKEK